ncbi:MAG TPA: LysR family transcriptional regulator [Steroidobacteraceae bacterium]|nr:LysR family transcriptional regulator [Steroidobacteraceae bacterium]
MSEAHLDWEDQRAFLFVVETGSLSAAARALRLTQPTVRRRIDALEQAIGQPLFSRGVNGLVPTEQARDLAEHVRRMEFASSAFRRAAAGRCGEISGSIRISVSEFVGIEVLPTMLLALRARHPQLSIELVLGNETADLLHQEADVAVRMHPPRQEALIARLVGHIDLGLFASRAYVEASGRPETLADLAAHALIGPDKAGADLALVDALAAPEGDKPRFAVRTDSHLAQLTAVRAGLGIGVVQVPIGERDLVRVLPDTVVHSLDVWIVAHEDLRRSARIDAIYSHLVEAFTAYCG